MNTDIVQRSTITALVGTYQQAESEIRQAYELLDSAKKRLDAAFISGTGYYFSINDRKVGTEAAEATMKSLKKDAWRCIVDRLEIRKILSIKRREELDRQLSGESRNWNEPPAPLPDVTEENIINMFQDGMSKATTYANEAVYEVFDWLRPQRGRTSDLKTNEKWRIGKKVIIGYAVEMGYGKSGTFRVQYRTDKNITALDNVMSMLDGKGPLKTHYGPLYDAINTSPDGTGETDYFRFKCCKNHNLHLEFLRPDLVDKINRTAGGNRIGNGL